MTAGSLPDPAIGRTACWDRQPAPLDAGRMRIGPRARAQRRIALPRMAGLTQRACRQVTSAARPPRAPRRIRHCCGPDTGSSCPVWSLLHRVAGGKDVRLRTTQALATPHSCSPAAATARHGTDPALQPRVCHTVVPCGSLSCRARSLPAAQLSSYLQLPVRRPMLLARTKRLTWGSMRPPSTAYIAVLVGLVPSVLAFQSPALAPLARVSQRAGAALAPLCVRQHCRLLRARGGATMLRAEAGANDLLVIGAGTLVEPCLSCSQSCAAEWLCAPPMVKPSAMLVARSSSAPDVFVPRKPTDTRAHTHTPAYSRGELSGGNAN